MIMAENQHGLCHGCLRGAGAMQDDKIRPDWAKGGLVVDWVKTASKWRD
jgi:hypothetical protein